MTIISISGAIGSGKSHSMLKVGLEHANRKRRQLVTNFPLNVAALEDYARHKGYGWIVNLCRRGGICQIHSPKDIQALFIPESICLMDEAQIFLNSRMFAQTPRELIADLCQSRKDGTDLIYCAQVDEHVDKQMRELTQFHYICKGFAVFDKVMQRPKLVYKRIYGLEANDFAAWYMDKKARNSYWKLKFAYSFWNEEGFLDEGDRKLFNCFNSYVRLDKDKQTARNIKVYTKKQLEILDQPEKLRNKDIAIITRFKCDLPEDVRIVNQFGDYPLLPPIPNTPTIPFPITPPPPAPPTPQGAATNQPTQSHSDLVNYALLLKRQKNIKKAPFFKQLTPQKLEEWIAQHA